MDIQKNAQSKMFELRPAKPDTKVKGGVFSKGRKLLGRTESCDLIVQSESVSAVHAVIEIFDNKAVVYDMNSTNGTYVNDDKVIVKEIVLGDTLRLADVEFIFQVYNVNASLPPVLDTLEPAKGTASVHKEVALPELPKKSDLPSSAPTVSNDGPSIIYPLAADPKAEFSEYIFEDKHELFPIFKYDTARQAVEVTILFKDQIFSIDYLPDSNHQYFITGIYAEKNQVEFPYLRKNEKLPFIEIRNGHVTVQTIPGFSIFFLSDKKKDSGHQSSSIELNDDDIIRLHKGELQIFVRNVQSPPEIAAPPVLKRDPEFQKYLFMFFFFVFLASVGMNLVEIPEDKKEEDDAPERLATILYKQPLHVNTNKSVAKTENAPKVAQKAPAKPAVAKPVENKPQPKVAKPDVIQTKDQTKKPDPGKKTATVKQVVKQGTKPVVKPTQKVASPVPSANKVAGAGGGAKAPVARSAVNSKAIGKVEVYKSADFSSTVSSLVAKGGSVSGIETKSAGGGSGTGFGAGAGVGTGIGSGSGDIKTAGIQTDQGSLVGATTGVLGNSKGAEGLSAKKAIYTAGIPSETVVLGSMDPDVIRRILLDHLPQFRYCYQKELEKTGAELSGVIRLEFTIGASGHVTGAGVGNESPLPSDVKRCVVGVLRGIQFPEPMGGGVVEVKQPMNFYPKKI